MDYRWYNSVREFLNEFKDEVDVLDIIDSIVFVEHGLDVQFRDGVLYLSWLYVKLVYSDGFKHRVFDDIIVERQLNDLVGFEALRLMFLAVYCSIVHSEDTVKKQCLDQLLNRYLF